MEKKKSNKASVWKSLMVGLAAFLGMAVIAYGFQVTKVDLEELSSEQRQESLIRVARAIARPDFFEYEQVEEIYNLPILVPCPADGNLPAFPEPDAAGPYLVVTPACASPGESVQVQGFGFAPNQTGPLRFVPGNDPANVVTLGRDTVKTDEDGNFNVIFVLPERESPEVQYIRVVISRNVGAPHFSQSARDTWDKIIETVFLALLATIAGTLVAVPISFLAARNLMKQVKSPLLSIALSLLGWMVGLGVGFLVVRWLGNASMVIGENPWVNLVLGGLSLAIMGFILRWAMPSEEATTPSRVLRLGRFMSLLVGSALTILGSFQLVSLMKTIGSSLQEVLGGFGFLGYFFFQAADILGILLPIAGGLVVGGMLGGFLGRLGQHGSEKYAPGPLRIINMVFTALAFSTLLVALGQVLKWIYLIENPIYTLWGPLGTGVVVGLLLAVLKKPKEALPIGLAIYFITRSILNALRSVEALVMAIVFVIAVGIGPFAGVLALGLHTIVSLAKLYSEQVESIMPGPLEAIQATGANRLQMIVYAVIPQIIPPYISYTMYRWDINVRMSTIIGFVGGGGIGFLLQQNINLLNYRGASAQMVAIAVVVASMDYISSVMREKTV